MSQAPENNAVCIDCFTKISKRSKRCRSCASIRNNSSKKKNTLCGDCGIEIKKNSIRCVSCYKKSIAGPLIKCKFCDTKLVSPRSIQCYDCFQKYVAPSAEYQKNKSAKSREAALKSWENNKIRKAAASERFKLLWQGEKSRPELLGKISDSKLGQTSYLWFH